LRETGQLSMGAALMRPAAGKLIGQPGESLTDVGAKRPNEPKSDAGKMAQATQHGRQA
jgi:hypothetical protein